MDDHPDPIQPLSGAVPSAESRSFHEILLDNLYDGVYFVDMERRITYWNKGAEQITGYSASEIIGTGCFDNLLMHVDEEGHALCKGECPLARTISDGKRREADVYLKHRFGHRIPVCIRVTPIMDSSGCIVGAVEVFSDATAKRNIEKRAGELERLAFLDALTGVANRRYVALKVQQALQEVQQFGRSIGLLMIDVDHFKRVNDTYGHETGDVVLQAVCKTLSYSVRPGDTVGRWGGEEFLVIVTDVNQKALGVLAERCRQLIAESIIPVGGNQHKITVSVGATLIFTEDSERSAIERADKLMYRSKMSGRNQTTVGSGRFGVIRKSPVAR